MKVLDFYNHQGHQYEFFKLGFDFYLLNPSLSAPLWNYNHRPLNGNVNICSLEDIINQDFDIVMYRTGSDEALLSLYRSRGSKLVFVSQTTFEPTPSIMPDAVVWNSHVPFSKYRDKFSCSNHYIPHGYDPEEFCPLENVSKNGRVLSLANMFKKRDDLLGYSMWNKINKQTGICDVFGHHNEDIGAKRISSFEDQILKFSQYSIYLNTTLHSAMPRSRAEAMMCGMPLVTTKNYGIDLHVMPDECFYIRSEDEAVNAINKLLNDDNLYEKMSLASRSAAKREFSLASYLKKWNKVFEEIL